MPYKYNVFTRKLDYTSSATISGKLYYHNDLNNLDYSSAGHIGFTSSVEWNQNGFENRTDSTMSFDDGTHTLTLTKVSDFSYWIAGVKYTKTGNDSVAIDDTKEGIHVIYYDGSTLTALANPTAVNYHTAILTKALVCILYWDVSESKAIYVGEERHGKGMSPSTHNYLHFNVGMTYLSGLGLNTMSVDQAGATADAQFGVDAGSVADEDIHLSPGAVAAATGLPIYYMLGAGAEWQKHTEAGFSVRTFDGTSADRLAWNEYTGGAWQLTEAANVQFVLCHVFATTEKDNPMIAVMGQATYGNKNAARTGATTEIHSLVLDDLLFPEIKPIATVIMQTSLAYANSVNARAVSTEDSENYVDWRHEHISKVALTTSDHNALSGLQGGSVAERYHLTYAQHNTVASGWTGDVPTISGVVTVVNGIITNYV